MTEEQIRIAQQLYGIIMILIRGAFLGLFLDLFLEKEILNRAKIIMISAVMTIIGLILFAIPFSLHRIFASHYSTSPTNQTARPEEIRRTLHAEVEMQCR